MKRRSRFSRRLISGARLPWSTSTNSAIRRGTEGKARFRAPNRDRGGRHTSVMSGIQRLKFLGVGEISFGSLLPSPSSEEIPITRLPSIGRNSCWSVGRHGWPYAICFRHGSSAEAFLIVVQVLPTLSRSPAHPGQNTIGTLCRKERPEYSAVQRASQQGTKR